MLFCIVGCYIEKRVSLLKLIEFSLCFSNLFCYPFEMKNQSSDTVFY